LEGNPQYRDYFDFIKEKLGGKQNMWASVALCCLPLKEGSRVEPHMDTENDPALSEVLNVSWVVLIDGQWQRYSLIYYMRKSIHDMFVRQGASSEMALKCSTYLKQCKPFMLPPDCRCDQEAESIKVALQYGKLYYETGVGLDGFLVTLDAVGPTIVGIALLSKPSCDKQANFLGPVAGGILAFMRCHKLFLEELVELLYVCGLLNGIYSLVNLLGAMQTDWSRKDTNDCPGGFVQYIFQRLVENKGSVQNGTAFPCQPFLNFPITVGHVQDSCKVLKDLVEEWRRDKPITKSGAETRELARSAIKSVSKNLRGVGGFTGHHIFHTAALIGMASKHHLDYAFDKDTMKTMKVKGKVKGKDTRGDESKLHLYLNHDLADSSLHEGRHSIIQTSVTRYLIERNKLSGLTESMLENILCEASRSLKVNDMHFPGQSIIMRGWERDTWWKVVPTVSKEGHLYYGHGGVLESAGDHLLNPPSDGLNQQAPMWNSDDVIRDVCIPYSSTSKQLQREVKVPASFINEHYPDLMPALRLALAEHTGSMNTHADYMSRLNQIKELSRAIAHYEMTFESRTRKRKRKPSPSSSPLSSSPSLVSPSSSLSASPIPASQIPPQALRPLLPSPSPTPAEFALQEKKKKKKKKKDGKKTSPTPAEFALQESSEKTMLFSNYFHTLAPSPTNVPTLSLSRRVPPLPPASASDTWISDHSYQTQHAISYRLYHTPQQADSVLLHGNCAWAGHVGSLPTVTKEWHTLANDVHAAICSQISRGEKESVDRIKIRKGALKAGCNVSEGGSGYLTVIESDTKGASKPWYYAVLECLPVLSVSGCLVSAAIAKSLGGKSRPTVPNCWIFERRETAIQHLLLCAICVVGDKQFYRSLVRRARKDAAGVRQGEHLDIAGYFADKTTIGYYLVVKDNPTGGMPTLIIVFPARRANTDSAYSQPYCGVRLM
jgi:hypothetical protein